MNDATPAHVVDLLAGAVGDLAGRRVAVLGLAYCGGVKGLAFSGALALVDVLRARGACWSTTRSGRPTRLRALGFEPHELEAPSDAAIVQADHPDYRTLGPADPSGRGGRCSTSAGARPWGVGGACAVWCSVPPDPEPGGAGGPRGHAGDRGHVVLRTQISLTEQERRALDAASVRTGRSIAALIRDAVDAIYGDEQSTDHDLAAMRRARGAGRVERSMGKLGWSECDRAGPLEGSR